MKTLRFSNFLLLLAGSKSRGNIKINQLILQLINGKDFEYRPVAVNKCFLVGTKYQRISVNEFIDFKKEQYFEITSVK